MSDIPQPVKPEKPPKPWPAIYTWIWPMLVDAGRSVGYALAVHGSMQRDFDIIAAPWTEDAGSPDELVDAIREVLQVYLEPEVKRNPHFYSEKPHGRQAWSLHLGSGAYIDLSVMPRTSHSETTP